MKFNQYVKTNRAELLPVTIDGQDIDDVYFHRLSAGEGLQLKEAFSGLLNKAGSEVAKLATADPDKIEEIARNSLSPEQLRAMFEFQALFTFLHLGDKDGHRVYTDRKEFDVEVPDEFVQAFYLEGSKLKEQAEPGPGEAEKNS